MKSTAAIAALLSAALLAACAGTSIGVRSGTAPSMRGSAPAPGTSYSSAAVRAEVNSNAYFGLLFLGVFAAGVEDDFLSWRDGPERRKPPQLAEDRAIAERDCSRPMAAPSANLRCK